MEILSTENLTKIYGENDSEVIAVNNVNFSVEKGELIAVVGSSGSGKSTLLHMLGGVEIPTSGSILIEGVNIANLKEDELAIYRRRKVGLIYQSYNLVPNISVEKNILLPLRLDGKKPNRYYYNELIERMGIEKKLKSFPEELSGGQQQRVAIARSLIYRPTLLLADEPTGNLDRKNSNEIVELLKMMNRNYHATIIFVTHNEEIALSCDRILTMIDGKLEERRI